MTLTITHIKKQKGGGGVKNKYLLIIPSTQKIRYLAYTMSKYKKKKGGGVWKKTSNELTVIVLVHFLLCSFILQ